MRISKIWTKEYPNHEKITFEFTGEIILRADGFEIAKDWLDPNQLLETQDKIAQICEYAVENNLTPLFEFKDQYEKYLPKIKGMVTRHQYGQWDALGLVSKIHESYPNLSNEEIITLIRRYLKDFEL